MLTKIDTVNAYIPTYGTYLVGSWMCVQFTYSNNYKPIIHMTHCNLCAKATVTIAATSACDQKFESHPEVSSGGSTLSRGYSSKLDRSTLSFMGRLSGAGIVLSSSFAHSNPSNQL